MKKIAAILAIVFVMITVTISVFLYVRSTPEYALVKIVEQVKKDDFEAVENNLTDEVYSKIEPIISISKNNIINSIVSLFTDDNYTNILVEKAIEIEWSVGDIIKNKRKASVTIGFDYEGKLQGTIDLELVKVEKKWKINNLYNLQIDKIDLITR